LNLATFARHASQRVPFSYTTGGYGCGHRESLIVPGIRMKRKMIKKKNGY